MERIYIMPREEQGQGDRLLDSLRDEMDFAPRNQIVIVVLQEIIADGDRARAYALVFAFTFLKMYSATTFILVCWLLSLPVSALAFVFMSLYVSLCILTRPTSNAL